MKKIISTILTIAIVCSLVLTLGITTAAAETNVNFDVNVDPNSLSSAGGTVTFKAVVKNNGDPISNIVLAYPGGATSVSLNNGNALATGEQTQHVNQDFKISTSTLEQALIFTLSYTKADGTPGSQTSQTIVHKKASTINVTGSASVDTPKIKAGEKATFTFNFKNDGDVKIENASLKAPPIEGGDVIGQPFSLNPGDFKKMTYTITVNSTIEVKPTLTFTADGTNQTKTLDTINVTVEKAAVQSALQLSLQADKETANAGDSVILTAKITNSGGDEITDLKLLDDKGQPVQLTDSSLDAGKSTEATVTVTPQSTGNYKYTVTGKNSAGDNVTAESNQVTVTIGSASATPSSSEEAAAQTLKIDVNADTYSLDSPGEVTFQVTVTNNSDVLLNNVKVTEKSIGDIGTISAMGRDSKTLSAKAEVKETTDYVFTVTATTADGQTVTAETAALPIEVKGGAGLGLDFWGILLLIIIIAIAAIGVVLFLLYRKNKKTGGPGMFGGSVSQTAKQGPYNARRKPSAFNNTISNNNDQPRDVQPPKAVRKPVATPPRPAVKKGNTKFGDRNKF